MYKFPSFSLLLNCLSSCELTARKLERSQVSCVVNTSQSMRERLLRTPCQQWGHPLPPTVCWEGHRISWTQWMLECWAKQTSFPVLFDGSPANSIPSDPGPGFMPLKAILSNIEVLVFLRVFRDRINFLRIYYSIYIITIMSWELLFFSFLFDFFISWQGLTMLPKLSSIHWTQLPTLTSWVV